MSKKIKIFLIFSLLFSINYAFADVYYEMGTKYLNTYQYSSAIDQFKKSLRATPNDYNSRIGLINSYLARATYYNNTAKDYQKSLNDLRSALFYIKYYDEGPINASLQSAAQKTEANIKELITILKPDSSAEGLLQSAKQLRNQSELPSSFIVYQKLLNTKYDKQASIASGDILRILRNPSHAIVYYSRALKNNPNDYEVLIKVGECYQEAGNPKLAAEYLNKALQYSKNSDYALNSLEKIWRHQIYVKPSDAEAHSNLGVIYQQKGDYVNALDEYKKAIELNPQNITTQINLATLYQEQKKYQDAINLYDKILITDAKNVMVRKYKAQCLQSMGRNDEALAEYKRVLVFNPDDAHANSMVFELAKKSENPQEFIALLTDNLERSTDKAQANYQLAYELHKNKNYVGAKQYYQASLEINPNQPDAYLNLSDVYLQLKEDNSALTLLSEGAAKFPANTQIKERLKQLKYAGVQVELEKGGQALLAGEYEKALSIYKAIQPENVDSLVGIASTYQSMGNTNDAILYYKKANLLDPNNAEILYYIATAYSSIEDSKNAKIYLQKVLAVEPNNQNAKNLMNYVSEEETQQNLSKALDLFYAKKYDEAYSLLTNMITNAPNLATAYYYRGMVLDEQKKYQLAINDYNNAIKSDSSFELAYYSLGVDYDTLKNYKEAYKNYNLYLNKTVEQNEYTQFAKNRIEELKKYVPNIAQVK